MAAKMTRTSIKDFLKKNFVVSGKIKFRYYIYTIFCNFEACLIEKFTHGCFLHVRITILWKALSLWYLNRIGIKQWKDLRCKKFSIFFFYSLMQQMLLNESTFSGIFVFSYLPFFALNVCSNFLVLLSQYAWYVIRCLNIISEWNESMKYKTPGCASHKSFQSQWNLWCDYLNWYMCLIWLKAQLQFSKKKLFSRIKLRE